MSLTVEICGNVSLNDLATLRRQGQPVFRSAHVGNMYPSNLAALGAGVPMVCFDRNIGHKDSNYHPHQKIQGGVQTTVCSEHLMMTHACVSDPTEGFPSGRPVAECHLGALRRALPNAELMTWTQYLERNEALVEAVVSIAVKERPDLWYRRVSADGVSKCIPRDQRPLPRDLEGNIHGLCGRESGWVFPNLLNVLLHIVVDSATMGALDVHHVSGPDMVRYIGSMQEDLSGLYRVVASNLGLRSDVRFCLYPGAVFRFVVPGYKRAELDTLYSKLKEYMCNERERGDAFRNINGRKKKDLQTELDQKKGPILQALRDASEACQDIFYDIAAGKHFTQHDLGPNELYVHPEAAQLPLVEVERLWKTLDRYGRPNYS